MSYLCLCWWAAYSALRTSTVSTTPGSRRGHSFREAGARAGHGSVATAAAAMLLCAGSSSAAADFVQVAGCSGASAAVEDAEGTVRQAQLSRSRRSSPPPKPVLATQRLRRVAYLGPDPVAAAELLFAGSSSASVDFAEGAAAQPQATAPTMAFAAGHATARKVKHSFVANGRAFATEFVGGARGRGGWREKTTKRNCTVGFEEGGHWSHLVHLF